MSDEFDEDLFEEDVAVPEKMRRALNRHRKGIDYVLVEHSKVRGRWSKIGKVEVEIDPNDATDAQLDAVAVEATRMAEEHAERRGGPGNYRIKIFRNKSAKGALKPVSAFRAGLDEEDDEDERIVRHPRQQEDDYDEDDLGAVAMIMQEQMTMLRASNEMVLALTDRIIKQAGTNNGSIEKLNQAIESLAVNYTIGINLQAEALRMNYSQQAAEKEAELKADTHKALLRMMGKAAPELFKQFGAYLGKKASEARDHEEDEQEHDENTIVVEATEVTGDTPGERALNAMTDEQREAFEKAPLTMTAKTFRDALETSQLIQISRAMTKKDYELFLSTMEQDNDVDTAKKVVKLKEVLEKKLDVALGLMSVFDEGQQSVLQAILGQAEIVLEHSK